jgi:hypothetical protein
MFNGLFLKALGYLLCQFCKIVGLAPGANRATFEITATTPAV